SSPSSHRSARPAPAVPAETPKARPSMRVHIGTDHAGFDLKNRLVAVLENKGHEVTDHGAHEYDAVDDYPPFCTDVGLAVVADPKSLGIVIGGSGNGEQIAANK